MSTANSRCIARPFQSDSDTSEDKELWLVSVPAVDYIRQAFFGALALLGDPESYDPVSDVAAEYGSEISASLTQIFQPGEDAVIVTEIVITPATTFPVLLKSMAAGETADEILVKIDAAFDAGSITIGDAASNDRLFPAAYNILDEPGADIQLSPQYEYAAETDVLVYMTGTPTIGSARVVLYSYLAGE